MKNTVATFKKAKETPTARASMLVAMASGSMVPSRRDLFTLWSSSLAKLSLTILPPIMASSTKGNASIPSMRRMMTASAAPPR